MMPISISVQDMRTTLEIADEVLRAAKKRAADEGVPLREIVERALRTFLNGGAAEPEPYRLQWRTEGGGTVNPEVDIDSRRSLHEFFEREEREASLRDRDPGDDD